MDRNNNRSNSPVETLATASTAQLSEEDLQQQERQQEQQQEQQREEQTDKDSKMNTRTTVATNDNCDTVNNNMPAAAASSLSGSSSSTENPETFVNQGLIRWEQSRSQWLGHKSSDTDSTVRAVAVPIEVDEIIDVVFSLPQSGLPPRAGAKPRKFPKPVPLPQMVDILVDLWEAAAD